MPFSVSCVATPREVIRRDWCAEDPGLRTLPNLKMANATNYPLAREQVGRLAALWSRTGHDFTRDESLAGLWAYARTFGGPVSQLPGSPVADVALRIGRVISGVYNKVMNFRHLDPRDERAGMSGASEADARVWDEFFDKMSGELQVQTGLRPSSTGCGDRTAQQWVPIQNYRTRR